MWFIHQPKPIMARMASAKIQCSHRETLPQPLLVFLIMSALRSFADMSPSAALLLIAGTCGNREIESFQIGTKRAPPQNRPKNRMVTMVPLR
ncbi:hypothetical protein [Bradyrhizobium sp. S3.7.6]